MDELGGTCSVGIHIAAHLQALLLGLLQHGQGPGDLHAPVVPAHGLQMADVNGYAQGPGHGEHFLQSLQHAAALLAHMHCHGDALPRQRLQRPNQLLRGVKALRGVSQAQGNAQGPVGQGLLHGPMDGLIVPVLQMLQSIARRRGAQHARAHQHAGVNGCLGLASKIVRQGIRGHLPADGLQVGGNLRPFCPAHRRGGQTAVAVYDGGQSLAQLRLAEAGPPGGQIRMAMDVDKARGHQLPIGADDPPGVGSGQGAHLHDPSVFHRHIGGIGGTAGTVHHGTAPNQV